MTTMSALRRTVVAPGAAVLLPAYLAGCFQYVPAGAELLPGPRAEVQVHLTTPIQVPMGEFTLEQVTRIEGVVARSVDDTLDLWAKWLYPRYGPKYDALGATFQVSKGSIARLDQYRFSPKRTALVLAVTGAVIVSFLQAVRLARADDGGGTEPPPETAIRAWPLWD